MRRAGGRGGGERGISVLLLWSLALTYTHTHIDACKHSFGMMAGAVGGWATLGLVILRSRGGLMTGHPKGLLDKVSSRGVPTGTLVGLLTLTGTVGNIQTHDGKANGSEMKSCLLVV